MRSVNDYTCYYIYVSHVANEEVNPAIEHNNEWLFMIHVFISCIVSLVPYTDRQEEDELVLQIVYVFYYLMLHQATRHTVLSTSRILTLH